MKKIYSKMFSILFLGFIGISSFAQGTWKTTGTETAINPGTAITTGITGLTVMHSDAATIIGKTDVATTVTYNNITWDNQSFVQGSTNGMYFAFRPTNNGTLDIPVKMGSAKKTFVLELTDACPNNTDLAALTTNLATGDLIFGNATYFSLPSVYDTYNQTTNTWDGTLAIQSTGANVYLVMSFPVLANKTYVVGVMGSKLMLRGANYTITTKVNSLSSGQEVGIYPNPAKGNVAVKMKESSRIAIYNATGALMKQQLVTPSDNNVDISGLVPGVYYVKDINNKIKTQKLIVK